jgi:hypothetical protein
LVDGESEPISGGSSENSEEEVFVSLTAENVKSISFTLTWTDESAGTGFENDPDEFSLSVETPNGTFAESEVVENSPGGQGSVNILITYDPDEPPYEEGTGTYTVTVICGNCGDHHSAGPFGIIPGPSDIGNDWDLSVDYDYYMEKEE